MRRLSALSVKDASEFRGRVENQRGDTGITLP
jgi:hypothetical protein